MLDLSIPGVQAALVLLTLLDQDRSQTEKRIRTYQVHYDTACNPEQRREIKIVLEYLEICLEEADEAVDDILDDLNDLAGEEMDLEDLYALLRNMASTEPGSMS